MMQQVDTYECEWKRVVDTPELQKKFRQFVNVDDKKYGDLEWVQTRSQKKIVVEDMPSVIGPAKICKDMADDSWRWVDVGAAEDFPRAGGAAVKVSGAELAIYNHSAVGQWYATQNSCPPQTAPSALAGLAGRARGGAKSRVPHSQEHLQPGER